MSVAKFQADNKVDWQSIEAVLLDMDGTLLDLQFDNYFWQEYLPIVYANTHLIDEEVARTQLYAMFDEVHGTLEWYNLNYWSSKLDLDIVSLKKDVQHLIRVRPGVWEFLDHLAGLGKRRILVTNAHPDSMSLKMQLTGMDRSLDALVSTHEYGFPKEELDFWRCLADKQRVDLSRALFIDDTPNILEAARAAGVAWVRAIAQPDCRLPPREPGEFPQIGDFAQFVLA